MFRRVEKTMDPDPVFPADFKALGFFINDVDHVRAIEAPDQPFIFHATNNERVNEVRREAMHECLRKEVGDRLAALGIHKTYLPGPTIMKPKGHHVSILAPPITTLKNLKRIIVLVNDANQDLGVLSYARMQRELGVNGGSVMSVASQLIERSAENNATPGLIVLNTGQLLYSHKHNKGMTLRSWSAMPRKSCMHDMIRIHDVDNRVPGHHNPTEHIKSVFKDVIFNPECIAQAAEIYLVAIEGGSEFVVNVLQEDFSRYGSRITAMALIQSLIDESQIKDPAVRAFLHQRTREFKFSDLTSDPQVCIQLPASYHVKATDPSETTSRKHVSWSEKIQPGAPASDLVQSVYSLSLQDLPELKEGSPSDEDGWSTQLSVICPTFAGGDNSTGEVVFTDPQVQQAVLSFFEQVAQDPRHYRNPGFEVMSAAPQPTIENPLLVDADVTADSFPSVQPEVTPEQAELDMAKDALMQMSRGLEACFSNIPELQGGRKKLMERITNQKNHVAKLEKQALAHGALKAGEAREARDTWKPQKEGPKVEFAGTMVDSELLKTVGLSMTAEEEEKKIAERDGNQE